MTKLTVFSENILVQNFRFRIIMILQKWTGGKFSSVDEQKRIGNFPILFCFNCWKIRESADAAQCRPDG